MLSIDSGSVVSQRVAPFSTSAAVAIVDIVTAAIPAERRRGVSSAKKLTGNINKAAKEDSITGIASGDGESASNAA